MSNSFANNKIVLEFNLTQKALNRPIHYRPKFVSQFENHNSPYKNQNNNKKHGFLATKKRIHYPSLSQISSSNYYKRKNANTLNLVEKIKSEQIDILINKIYDKANNKIREYSYDLKEKNSFKNLDPIYRKQIKSDISNKYQKFYNKTQNDKNNELKLKRYFWSEKILDNKKNNEYKKMYRIKFIKNSDKDIIKGSNQEFPVDLKKIIYRYFFIKKSKKKYSLGLKMNYINNKNIYSAKVNKKNVSNLKFVKIRK